MLYNNKYCLNLNINNLRSQTNAEALYVFVSYV